MKYFVGQWWCTPVNPSTQKAEAGGSLWPAWSTRASSRTGSKATEKPCLEKNKKQTNKQKKIYPDLDFLKGFQLELRQKF